MCGVAAFLAVRQGIEDRSCPIPVLHLWVEGVPCVAVGL